MLIPGTNKEGMDLTMWFDSPLQRNLRESVAAKEIKPAKALNSISKGEEKHRYSVLLCPFMENVFNVYITAMTHLG